MTRVRAHWSKCELTEGPAPWSREVVVDTAGDDRCHRMARRFCHDATPWGRDGPYGILDRSALDEDDSRRRGSAGHLERAASTLREDVVAAADDVHVVVERCRILSR